MGHPLEVVVGRVELAAGLEACDAVRIEPCAEVGPLGPGELAGLGVVRGLRLPLEVGHSGGVALEEEAPEARGLQVGGSCNESWIRGLGVAKDGRDDLVVHLVLLEDRVGEAPGSAILGSRRPR